MLDGTVFACNSNQVNPSKFASQIYKFKRSPIFNLLAELPVLMMKLW